LIGGGYFLVEVVEVFVFVGGGEGEGTREGASDRNLAWVGFGLDEQDCPALPGNFAGLRGALDLKISGKAVNDLIGNLFAEMHIYRGLAFVLIDEGMAAARFKEEAGTRTRFEVAVPASPLACTRATSFESGSSSAMK
jgi:hypothetical protein